MNLKSSQFIVEKERITNMAEKVLAEYKGMRDERSQIDDWEWENDFYFTILGAMEIFSSYVGGYASQIATRGSVREPKNAVKLLETSRLFDQSYFVKWYFAPDNKYVKVKQYVDDLDYLRLLIIEYISHHQNGGPSITHSATLLQRNGNQNTDSSVVSEEIAHSLSIFSVPDGAKVPAEFDLLVSSS
jgi:hypothetical protein